MEQKQNLDAKYYLPMNKSSLCKHEVELMVEPGPSLHDGCCIGEAADCAADLGQVTPGHHCRGLVVDAYLLIVQTYR
jgi:hypothetical protein